MMYQNLIREKFPHDETLGLYRAPKLPAVQLGKILRRDTRVASPSDVLALWNKSGLFSSRYLLLTAKTAFFDGGSFALEDVRGAKANETDCVVQVNRQGVGSEALIRLDREAALSLARFFNDLAYRDPVAESVMQSNFEGLDPAQVAWLGIRDEVLRTIDLLYDRYNDGKISLLDYEGKKEELLGRL